MAEDRTTTALTLAEAGSALKDLFVRTRKGAPELLVNAVKRRRRAALALLAANPQVSLPVLYGSSDFSLAAKAAAFDEIVGEQPNADAARDAADVLSAESVSELMVARGGLPSAAILSLRPRQVIAAVLEDAASLYAQVVDRYVSSAIADRGRETSGEVIQEVVINAKAASIVFLMWAQLLKDRDDWETFRDLQVMETDDGEPLSVADLILFGILNDRPDLFTQSEEEDEDDVDDEGPSWGRSNDIDLGVFEDYGLDEDWALERLDDLRDLEERLPDQLSSAVQFQLKQANLKRKKKREKEAAALSRVQEAEALSQDAEDVDFTL